MMTTLKNERKKRNANDDDDGDDSIIDDGPINGLIEPKKNGKKLNDGHLFAGRITHTHSHKHTHTQR